MIPFKDILLAVGVPFILVLGLRKFFTTATDLRIITPFLQGAATAFVALLVEFVLWEYFSEMALQGHSLMVHAFLYIAFPEELVKISLIYLIVVKYYERGFRQIGVLAAAIGAGFAAAENLSYISQFGNTVIVSRLLTATPFHIFVSIVSAKLIFFGRRKGRSEYIGVALIVATALHGIYDYLILSDHNGNQKFLFALALTSSLAINLLRQENRT